MDTLFICFLVDEEMSTARGTEMFARRALQDLIYNRRLRYAKLKGTRAPAPARTAVVPAQPSAPPAQQTTEQVGGITSEDFAPAAPDSAGQDVKPSAPFG
eukprot:g69137.t1